MKNQLNRQEAETFLAEAAGRGSVLGLEHMQNLMEELSNVQEALANVMERQELFARQLEEQKRMLADTCSNMSDEISSQLYTFEQMRNLYEE